MQSLSGYSWPSYNQIPGVQRSSQVWRSGRNWTLLNQIYGLHLALHVIEQRNKKGEFVEALWNMIDRTCSRAERQQRYLNSGEHSWSKEQVK